MQRGKVKALIKIRVSVYTHVILVLCVLELLCVLLSLLLPWGKSALGDDIRAGQAGLLPWYLLVPILLQLACVTIESGVLQGFCIITNFVIGAFIIFDHCLTYIKYGGFKPGFYLMFAGGAIALLAGIACLIERRAFPRLLEAGKARVKYLSPTQIESE